MTYVFTCPHSDCWAELEPGDGFNYWCPAEEMEIPAGMVEDEAWGTTV